MKEEQRRHTEATYGNYQLKKLFDKNYNKKSYIQIKKQKTGYLENWFLSTSVDWSDRGCVINSHLPVRYWRADRYGRKKFLCSIVGKGINVETIWSYHCSEWPNYHLDKLGSNRYNWKPSHYNKFQRRWIPVGKHPVSSPFNLQSCHCFLPRVKKAHNIKITTNYSPFRRDIGKVGQSLCGKNLKEKATRYWL